MLTQLKSSAGIPDNGVDSETNVSSSSNNYEDIDVKTLLKQRNMLREELKAAELFSKSIFEKYTKVKKDSLQLKSRMKVLLQSKHESDHEAGLLTEKYEEGYRSLLEENVTYKRLLNEKDKELETLKQKHRDMKKNMLQKVLFSQFSANQFFISRNIQQCRDTLVVINKLNHMFEKKFGFRVLSDDAEWLKAHNDFEIASADNEKQHSELKASLEKDEYLETHDDVVLEVHNIPAFPTRSQLSIVEYALNKYEETLVQVWQHSMLQKPVPYQQIVPNQFYRGVPLLNVLPQNMQRYQCPAPSITNPNIALPIPPVSPNLASNIRPQKSQVNKSAECNNNVIIEGNKPGDKHIESNDIKVEQNKSGSAICKNSTGDKNQESRDDRITSEHGAKVKEDTKNDIPTNSSNSNRENKSLNIAKGGLTFKAENVSCDNQNFLRKRESGTTQDADTNGIRSNVIHTGDMYRQTVKREETNRNKPAKIRTTFSKQINKIICQLRFNYPGIMELDLLESILDVKQQYNGVLSGLSLKIIIQEAHKYILERQERYLCMYITPETPKPAKDPMRLTSVKSQVKTTRQQNLPSKQNVKNAPKIIGNPTPEIPKMNSKAKKILENQTSQPNLGSSESTVTSTKNKVPSAYSTGCAWGPILSDNKTWKKESGENECIICMESVKSWRHSTYTLKCQHSFHKACIKAWFQQNQTCPTCRLHCTIDDEFPPLPS